MDRQMEPTSQIFSQGGILSRDWFSDKLQNKERFMKIRPPKKQMYMCQVTECREVGFNMAVANWALPTALILMTEVSTVAKLRKCSDVGQTSNFTSTFQHRRFHFIGLKAALNCP